MHATELLDRSGHASLAHTRTCCYDRQRAKRLPTCPASREAASLWLRPNRFFWVYAKLPMKPESDPSITPRAERPPPAEKPPAAKYHKSHTRHAHERTALNVPNSTKLNKTSTVSLRKRPSTAETTGEHLQRVSTKGRASSHINLQAKVPRPPPFAHRFWDRAFNTAVGTSVDKMCDYAAER